MGGREKTLNKQKNPYKNNKTKKPHKTKTAKTNQRYWATYAIRWKPKAFKEFKIKLAFFFNYSTSFLQNKARSCEFFEGLILYTLFISIIKGEKKNQETELLSWTKDLVFTLCLYEYSIPVILTTHWHWSHLTFSQYFQICKHYVCI